MEKKKNLKTAIKYQNQDLRKDFGSWRNKYGKRIVTHYGKGESTFCELSRKVIWTQLVENRFLRFYRQDAEVNFTI